MKNWEEKLNPDNWSWSWIFGILGFLLCVNLFGPKGLLHLVLLQQQTHRLQNSILILQDEINQTQKEFDSFKTSRDYQQNILRDRMGYLRPHEFRVEFISQKSNHESF